MNKDNDKFEFKRLTFLGSFSIAFLFVITNGAVAWAIHHLFLKNLKARNYSKEIFESVNGDVITTLLITTIASFFVFMLFSWGNVSREKDLFKIFEEKQKQAIAEALKFFKQENLELKTDLNLAKHKVRELEEKQ